MEFIHQLLLNIILYFRKLFAILILIILSLFVVDNLCAIITMVKLRLKLFIVEIIFHLIIERTSSLIKDYSFWFFI